MNYSMIFTSLHRCRLVLILALVAMVCLVCKSLVPTSEELDDSSRALHIRLNSEPPGASVYGLAGDSIGVFLGVTPMTCKYIYRKLATGPVVFGTEVEQTITRHIEIGDGLSPPYTFHCWLIKEGYKAQLVYQSLQLQGRQMPISYYSASAFKPGTKSVTVELVLLDN